MTVSTVDASTATWLDEISLDSPTAVILSTAYWSGFYASAYADFVNGNEIASMFENEYEASEQMRALGDSLLILGNWLDDENLMDSVSDVDRDDLWHLLNEAAEAGSEISIMNTLNAPHALGFQELKGWASTVFDLFAINPTDAKTYEALFTLASYVDIPSGV